MMILWATSVALATTPDAGSDQSFLDAVQRMLIAIDDVQDATYVLHQHEFADGKLQDPDEVEVRYLAPNTVYMEWSSGQRILWRPGHNDDRMRVDPGRLLPTVSLSPESRLATKGQRHTVRRMGLVPIAELFRADTERILADRERLAPEVRDLGTSTLYGVAVHCYDARMRRDLEPALYGDRVEVCLDVGTDLPIRMRTWEQQGGTEQLVESYGYEKLRVNVGVGPLTPEALGL